MAGAQRKPDLALKQLLHERARFFSFFQAVQLLHRLDPNATPVGELGPVEAEALRFTHDHRLIFHAGDVSGIELKESGSPKVSLTSTFLGLTGASSPLATHFAEEVIIAELSDEKTLKAFYDLLHHRALSLFYRAWKKYRFGSGFRLGGKDDFSRRALAFVGVDLLGSVPRHGLPPIVQLSLAPLLSMRTRPQRTLEIVLARLFPGVEVTIVPFIAREARIDLDQRVQLGVANTTLSADMTLGERVYDRSGRFRICVGPVEYDAYEKLMPGGEFYPTLRGIVEQFTRGVLECELEVRLSEVDNAGFQLGSARYSRLGVSTQLGSATGKGVKRMRVLLSEDEEKAKPYPVLDEDAAA